ncbi:hypothetical protein [Pseudomonas sp.]|uniref:hypothetical protein n=1 Tax=Pseudomonas sp. TaxID=306 RepID=UPI003C3C8FF0
MNVEKIKSDLDKVATNYRLLAEAVMQIRDTPLVHDPDFIKILEELRDAMAIYREQIRLLSECTARRENIAGRSRPVLHLVKR